MGVSPSFEGMGDLLEEVERMAAAPARVESDALKAGAHPICDEAKRTSAFHDRTGKLRKSIKVGSVKSSAKKGKYILVEADDPIANVVESGHGGPAPAPPHPFMRPAFEAKKDEAYEIIRTKLKEAL